VNSRAKAKHELDEFEEDLGFQRLFWTVERAAWIAFALLIAAALAGLTGAGGPLAHAKAETPYGSIEYPRVSRWQTADDMVIQLRPAAGSLVEIEIDRRFVEAFEIVSIQPEPQSAAATPNGMRYTFDVESGGAVVFQLRAMQPAFIPDGSIRIGDAKAPVRSLILP